MTDRRPRVVVTGLGVVSAAGCDLETFWRNLEAGRSAVRRIERFDAAGYPSRIAGEIGDDMLEAVGDRWADGQDLGRIARFAGAAAALAIDDARLMDHPDLAARAGVAIASGMGAYAHDEVFVPCAAAGRSRDDDFDWDEFARIARTTLEPRSLERQTPGSVPALVARRHGLGGPILSVMTACAGGAQAIGDALRWIRTGRAEVVVAGGADSELYPMGLASFCLLGALSRRNDEPPRASRPFDAGRDGFVMGEGAAMLVLEERTAALRRGARIYAEVAGFGSACDAYRVTDPHPDGRGAVLAMQRALSDARLAPGEIGYINAHGTSTAANDRIETVAIRSIFGQNPPPVSSTKSMIGHATVAAGAIEAAATVLTLVHQRLHPTINQDDPDPACDLDYVPNLARTAVVEAALTNSFAFGGQTASLAFRRWPD
jgi:3-oxoacyl-[acyl-carrier-protein] synthase II